MARISGVVKKWTDFSASETKPLFWMLLGPLSVILTTIIAIPSFVGPYLLSMTVVGFILSWRYRLSGFFLTLMFFIFYFAFHYFFGDRDAFLWKVGWGSSLVLGLMIAFLSMEELKSYYRKEKREKEKALRELQTSFHSFEEKAAAEKRASEKEVETLKEGLDSSREEVEVLLNLVEASRIESDKFCKKNEMYAADSIEFQRKIEGLKRELDEAKEKLTCLEAEHDEVSQVAKQRLKELNTLRVAFYQSRLLAEAYQKQVQRARAYFKTKAQEKKKASAKENPSASSLDPRHFLEGENQVEQNQAFLKDEKQFQKTPPNKVLGGQEKSCALKVLEKNKGVIKEAYDQMLKNYQKLKVVFDEKSLKLQKAPHEALHIEIASLGREMKEKRQKLDQTKSELVGIEREIFVFKKTLQEQGSFAC